MSEKTISTATAPDLDVAEVRAGYQDVDMTGEFLPAGDSPGPGAEPELRASHADRDRVVEILRVAAGDGLLTAAELDERLRPAPVHPHPPASVAVLRRR